MIQSGPGPTQGGAAGLPALHLVGRTGTVLGVDVRGIIAPETAGRLAGSTPGLQDAGPGPGLGLVVRLLLLDISVAVVIDISVVVVVIAVTANTARVVMVVLHVVTVSLVYGVSLLQLASALVHVVLASSRSHLLLVWIGDRVRLVEGSHLLPVG